jgi:predicted homoserine dehydrogenase-like protein
MFGLDKCLKQLDVDGTPIRTSVVGAGFMGGTLASQVNTAPGMEIDVVAVATGVPAAYAHIALNAIRNKKHSAVRRSLLTQEKER